MFCGLGLRPTIWEEFTQRFGIRKIAELYGNIFKTKSNIKIY